jgi:hypothetical protein
VRSAIRTPEGLPLDPTKPPLASTYYHPTSTHVLGLDLMRMAFQENSRPASVGIVGLGAGAMACHALPGERWRFFDIDPLAVAIAKNPRLFNYLSSCLDHADIVMGDARITLAQQARGLFDYLLIDAFTSDAVPVHLLTVEALQMNLSDRGVSCAAYLKQTPRAGFGSCGKHQRDFRTLGTSLPPQEESWSAQF